MTDRIRCLSALALVVVAAAVTLSGTAQAHGVAAAGGEDWWASNANYPGVFRRPKVKVAGWLRQAEGGHWFIGERVVHIDPAVPLDGSAEAGMYAVVKAGVDEQGQLWANGFSSLPGVELSTEVLPPELQHLVAASPAGPAGYTVEFRGLIQETQPRYWVVGNRLVFIANTTVVQGRPQTDALAEVKGTFLYGHVVLAKSVKVTLPDAFAEVEFEGIVESLGERLWKVSGVAVAVGQATVVEGTPALGMLAEVRGVLQPDESVQAQRIRVKSPDFTPQVDVEGVVEQIETTHWIVGSRVVLINSSTFIDESRAPAEVGMWAQVRALYQHDGSLLALRIRLSRSG